jgi:hypothetical protein
MNALFTPEALAALHVRIEEVAALLGFEAWTYNMDTHPSVVDVQWSAPSDYRQDPWQGKEASFPMAYLTMSDEDVKASALGLVHTAALAEAAAAEKRVKVQAIAAAQRRVERAEQAEAHALHNAKAETAMAKAVLALLES